MREAIQKLKEVASCLLFLKKYIIYHKQTLILFTVSWGIEGVLNLLFPILTGILIDQMVYYKEIQTFIQIALFILGIAVFWCLIYFVIYSYCNRILGNYTFDIKNDLIDRLLGTNFEDFVQLSSGDFINTIQVYTTECVKIITNNLIYTIYCGGMVLFFCVYIFLQNWVLGIVAVFFSFFNAYVTVVSSESISRNSEEQRKQYGKYVGWLNSIFYGLRDIHFLLAQGQIRDKFSVMIHELNRTKNRKERYILIISNLSEILNLCMKLIIYGLCAYFVAKGNMTLGVFTVISIYFGDLSQNLIWLNGYYTDIKDRVSYISYIKKYMELPEEEHSDKSLKITEGNIIFHNVSFTWKNKRKLFENLNLSINPGEKIAVIGKSGCGKSTLMSMLVGLIEPGEGYIEIDNQRIEKYSKKSLRYQIGIVHQTSVLFDDTIRNNILLGKKNASEEQITKACELACIWKWIVSLPEGLDTVLNADNNLSTGQKQRIAIARAYLKNDKILILDEATSSLDASLEKELIIKWRDDFFEKKTLIVISHRLETVKACDRIAVMDQGKIIKVDTTENMIQSSLFKKIFS